MPDDNVRGQKGVGVLSRGGKILGRTTGGTRRCRLSGCGGIGIATRWPKGTLTYPCTKGMDRAEHRGEGCWEILS